MRTKKPGLFARAPFTKDAVARRELAMAHAMVAMLALSLFALIATSTRVALRFDPLMATIAGVALILVALFSIGIVIKLATTKR